MEQMQENKCHLRFCFGLDRTTIVIVAILPGVVFIDPNVIVFSPLCGFIVSDPGIVSVNQYMICVCLRDSRQVSVENRPIGKKVHECQKELFSRKWSRL